MLNDQELYGSKLKIAMDHVDSNSPQILPKGLKSVGPGLGAKGVHLRDIVRQYERYVKGFNSSINSEYFLERDDHNYCKTVPRNGPGTNSQGRLTKSLYMIPLRQNPIPQPLPTVSYVGNYIPHGPMNYGPQTIPGSAGHPVITSQMGPMPNPGLPGPMISNIPSNCPVAPVRPIGPIGNNPVCPARQIGPNIPMSCPMSMGPVPAPIGPVPRPGNPVVGQRAPFGANACQSPSISPIPAIQQAQEPVTVELSNVRIDNYLINK